MKDFQQLPKSTKQLLSDETNWCMGKKSTSQIRITSVLGKKDNNKQNDKHRDN